LTNFECIRNGRQTRKSLTYAKPLIELLQTPN
jgi:hypothetical protein